MATRQFIPNSSTRVSSPRRSGVATGYIQHTPSTEEQLENRRANNVATIPQAVQNVQPTQALPTSTTQQPNVQTPPKTEVWGGISNTNLLLGGAALVMVLIAVKRKKSEAVKVKL